MLKKNNEHVEVESKKEKVLPLQELKTIKTLDIDSSPGFFCDVETGICGPITQEKEGK